MCNFRISQLDVQSDCLISFKLILKQVRRALNIPLLARKEHLRQKEHFIDYCIKLTDPLAYHNRGQHVDKKRHSGQTVQKSTVFIQSNQNGLQLKTLEFSINFKYDRLGYSNVMLHIFYMIVSHDLNLVLPTPHAIHIALCDFAHSPESICVILDLHNTAWMKWGRSK